jgi:hypothetical protein
MSEAASGAAVSKALRSGGTQRKHTKGPHRDCRDGQRGRCHGYFKRLGPGIVTGAIFPIAALVLS